MNYQPGDRVRWQTTGADGLPLVRYGFVGAGVHNGEVRVMLDGELKGNTMLPADDLALVHITTIELRVAGIDLLGDPAMCQGLVHLWTAEADEAGLDLGPVAFLPHDSAPPDNTPIALARIEAGGYQYILQACPSRNDAVHVKAVPAPLL
ncbi:MAG TPA: hypothetical protein VNQ73_14105 [Ilumatobacter sp.]|nr:hypothetical protein [Ilumatobacter sp.]